jgi:glycosyltransferase involved in cell wall biosynthesis
MPVYNEEATVETVVTEWVAELNRLEVSFVLLVINDGSRDGTGLALQKLAQRYPDTVTVCNKQNAGYGQACRTGYSLAVDRSSAWTLQIDSDGQCDPRFFSSFWNGRDQADAIFGLRTTRDDGARRTLISQGCRLATSLVCGTDLKDANVPYRLIRTSKLKEALRRIPDDFEMQNVGLTLALKRDPALRWTYVPIRFRQRQGGTTKFGFRRVIALSCRLLLSLHKIGK